VYLGPNGDQVVDEHTDVGVGTVENERAGTLGCQCGVDASHDALRRGFFVAA
jgi:hypothetical protein